MLDREKLTSAVIVLFSLTMLTLVIPNNVPPYQGYGVSPGLIPNAACGLMLFLSLIRLAGGMIRRNEEKGHSDPHDQGAESSSLSAQGLHLLTFFLPCFLVVPVMAPVGFIPAGIAFMLVLQYLCGQRNAVKGLAVSAITVVVIYLAMVYGFKVPMP